MAENRNKQSHDAPRCGHPKADGSPCGLKAGWGTKHSGRGNCRKHGGAGGAPEGNQNAAGHGAPAGNQNARKHGLFANYLGPDELAVYEEAKQRSADELGRDTAEFLIAKVAGAYRSDRSWEEASRLVQKVLSDLVADEKILPEVADALAARLDAPDLGTLGKALGPLKGLLEVKKVKDAERQANALDALTGAILRSQARRDAKEGGEG